MALGATQALGKIRAGLSKYTLQHLRTFKLGYVCMYVCVYVLVDVHRVRASLCTFDSTLQLLLFMYSVKPRLAIQDGRQQHDGQGWGCLSLAVSWVNQWCIRNFTPPHASSTDAEVGVSM